MFLRRITLRGGAGLLLAAAVGFACGAPPAAAQKKQKAPKYTVPANTTIRLRLNDPLSSKDARVGGTFASTVVTPLYVRGVEVVPAGSIVTGHVTHVTRASRKSNAGSINVTFTRLDLPNGAGRYVQGASGYDYTIVNGEVFMDHGTHTGALNGTVVRSEP